MFLGGFIAVSLSCAILIFWAIESRGESWPRRALDSKAMVWIGKRSYGLYLYHMPLVIWSLLRNVPDQATLLSQAPK